MYIVNIYFFKKENLIKTLAMFFLFTNKKKKKMTNRSQSRDAWQHNNNQKIRWSAFDFQGTTRVENLSM